MKKRRYQVGDQFFEIPENEVSGFLKDFPKAIEVRYYNIKGANYNIPIGDVDAFETDMGIKKDASISSKDIAAFSSFARSLKTPESKKSLGKAIEKQVKSGNVITPGKRVLKDNEIEEEAGRRLADPYNSIALNGDDPYGNLLNTIDNSKSGLKSTGDVINDENEKRIHDRMKELVRSNAFSSTQEASDYLANEVKKVTGYDVAVPKIGVDEIRNMIPDNTSTRLALDKLDRDRYIKMLMGESSSFENFAFKYKKIDDNSSKVDRADAVASTLTDPDVIDAARFDPRTWKAYLQSRGNYNNNFPEIATKDIGSKIAQKLEDEGKTNWFYDSPSKATVREAVEEMYKNKEIDEQQRAHYYQFIDPKVDAGFLKEIVYGQIIPTSALALNVGSGLETGIRRIGKSLGLEAAGLLGHDDPSKPIVEPKGVLHAITGSGGRLVGEIAPMIVAAIALKHSAIGFSDGAANFFAGVLQFGGANAERSEQVVPGDPVGQFAYTTLTTLFDAALLQAPVGKARLGITKLFEKDIRQIAIKLSDKTITNAAKLELKNEFLTKATKFISRIPEFTTGMIKENVKNATIFSTLNLLHTGADIVFDAKDIRQQIDNIDLAKDFGNNFLSSTFLSSFHVLGNMSKGVASQIRTIAEHPDTYLSMARGADIKTNIKLASELWGEISKMDKFTDAQKQKLLILSLSEKVNEKMSAETSISGMKKKYEEAKKSAIEQQQLIVSGEDQAPEIETYQVGITNATPTIEGLKAKLEKAHGLIAEGKFDEANQLHQEILDEGRGHIETLFEDMPDVKVEVDDTKSNYFDESEPSFRVTIESDSKNLPEIKRRFAELADKWNQRTVHVSRVEPYRDGVEYGVEQEDGSVYEPNVTITFNRELTDGEMADVNKKIKEVGLDGSTSLGNKTLILYNISKNKPHEQFTREIEQLKQKLNEFNGISGKAEANIRRLWNIGSAEDGATRTYEQIRSENVSAKQEAKPGAKVITSSNLNELDNEIKSRDGDQKKVLQDIKSVVKSINSIAKDVSGKDDTKVFIHDGDTYAPAVIEAGGTRQDAETKGFWMAKDGSIHLNMKNVTSGTMLHEGFHPVLDYVEKHAPEKVEKLYDELQKTEEGRKIIESVSRLYNGDKTIRKESITHFIEAVADGKIKINDSNFETIKNFIKKVLNTLGFDFTIKENEFNSVPELQQFAKRISGKMKSGREITDTDLGTKRSNSLTNDDEVVFSKVKKDEPLDNEQKVIAVKFNPGLVDNAIKVADSGAFKNKIQFKNVLQDMFKKYIPKLKKVYGRDFNPSELNNTTRRYISDVLTEEAKRAIDKHPEAIGWYNEKTQKALGVISIMHPEIKTDKKSRGVFILGLAATSSGVRVDDNFRYAERQYQYFKDNGRFDTEMEFGIQQKGIRSILTKINSLLDRGVTMEDINDFFTTKHKAKELQYRDNNNKLKYIAAGELKTEDVFGAVMIGSKIGNGYYMNLWGDFSQLTMDRWFMRTWGRVTGGLVEVDPAKVAAAKDSVSAALTSLKKDKKALSLLSQIGDIKSSMSVEKIANKVARLAMNKHKRAVMTSHPLMDKLRLASNRYMTVASGEIEAPSNGSQRKFIRDTFSDIQKRLKDSGTDITMADLQAALWYPEKILYESFKDGENYSGASEGYTSDTAPDYLNSAIRLAKEKGVSDEQIRQATSGKTETETEPGGSRGVRWDSRNTGRNVESDSGSGSGTNKTSWSKIKRVLEGEAQFSKPEEGGTEEESGRERIASEVDRKGGENNPGADEALQSNQGTSGSEVPVATINSSKTQDFFSKTVTGSHQPKKAWSPIMKLSEVADVVRKTYDKFMGNFDAHISTSIPGFRDVQIRKINGILKTFQSKPARILDIGGSEGGFDKTITELSKGKIETYNLDINPDMIASHNAKPIEGSYAVQESFAGDYVDGDVSYKRHVPKEKYDLVHETMTIQFFEDKDRHAYVKEIKDNLLKEDGAVILEEKVVVEDDKQWLDNEIKKDTEFKSQYYTVDQIAQKGEEVLVGMKKGQADESEFITALTDNFDYVYQYWDSGNFKGYIGSNNKTLAGKLITNIGDTQTKFSTKKELDRFTPDNKPQFSRSLSDSLINEAQRGLAIKGEKEIIADLKSRGVSEDVARNIVENAKRAKQFKPINPMVETKVPHEEYNKNQITDGQTRAVGEYLGGEMPGNDFDRFYKDPYSKGWMKRVRNLAGRFFARYFTAQRGMPEWFTVLKDKSIGEQKIRMREASRLMDNVKATGKKIGFSDWKLFDDVLRDLKQPEGEKFRPLSEETGVQVFDPYRASDAAPHTIPDNMLPQKYNRGKMELLPEELRPLVLEMRAQIDGLSRDLVVGGLVSPEQALVIESNMGEYMHRSYEAYNKNDWSRNIKDDIKKDAFRFLAQEAYAKVAATAEGMTQAEMEAQAGDMANKRLQEIIDGVDDNYSPKKYSVNKGKDLSTLKIREDIPEPIRKLLGEYTDPGANFMITISKLATLKSQAQMLQRVRDLGMGELFFEENDPNRPQEYSVPAAADGSETWSPLNGLMTKPEFKELLHEQELSRNLATKIWLGTIGLIRYGKTVLSPITQIRNLISNTFFAMMNGHYHVTQMAKGGKYAMDSLFKGGKINYADINEVISENLIGQNVTVGELKNMLQNNDMSRFIADASMAKKSAWQKAKDIMGWVPKQASKMYQVSDELWKVYGYLNERMELSQADYGKKYDELTPEQQQKIKTEAAERVKNTYPTYSRVWEGLAWLSKNVPIFGNFLSFQAESVRVAANSVHYAISDLKNPRRRGLGAKKLVGITTYIAGRSAALKVVASSVGVGLSGVMSWSNDDEENQKLKDVNRYAASFQKTGDKIVKTIEPGVYYVYDASTLDPYGIWWRTTNAYTSGGEKGDDGVLGSVRTLVDPFIEPEMTWEVYQQIRANKDANNNSIYSTHKPKGEQIMEALDFAYRKLRPSAIDLEQRLRKNGVEMEALSGIGAKPIRMDVNVGFVIKLGMAEERFNSIYSEYMKKLYKATDEGEKKQIANQANEYAKGIVEELHEDYMAALRLGVPKDKLRMALNKKKFYQGYTNEIKRGVLDGEFKNRIYNGKLKGKGGTSSGSSVVSSEGF